jgi:hypothetical protein
MYPEVHVGCSTLNSRWFTYGGSIPNLARSSHFLISQRAAIRWKRRAYVEDFHVEVTLSTLMPPPMPLS